MYKYILIFLVVMLMIPQLSAQSITLGPQIGFQKASDADGNLMFGAALRLKLAKALGVEGSINYRQEDFAGDALTVRSWPVMLTGMVYPLSFAYGAVGAGWYNTTFDFEGDLIEDETRQEFGWHFGGGLELPISSRTSLTGDIRYVFLDYNFDEVPFQNVDSNFYVITAGIQFGL